MRNNFQALCGRGESELVCRAQQGSEDAFAELLRRSRTRLWRTATAILKNPEEAEDVLQNACWSAYQHLPGFRLESSFNTWMTSIVVNHARMRLRELRRAPAFSMEEAPGGRPAAIPQAADRSLNPEEAYAGEELLGVLSREMRRLPAQLRHIMLLYAEEVPMPEAAGRLGLSVAAAKTRLFRARRELYSRMRRHAQAPVRIV